MNPGLCRFFSLEGVDGSGKTTQMALLLNQLQMLGMEAISVREPGGTPVSDQIRKILLAPENVVVPIAELLLYSAARAQLVTQIIDPALKAGKVVLADRFGWSTLAYQGFGRGLNHDHIRQLFDLACGNIWPLHSFLLDIPVAAMRTRLVSDGRPADRMENENAEFFARVREGYLTIAGENPDRFTRLDGTLPAHELNQAILKKVKALLASAG